MFLPLFLGSQFVKVHLPNLEIKKRMGDLMLTVLPVLSLGLLGAVAIWFVWPFLADIILPRIEERRADMGREGKSQADILFASWTERG